MSSLQNKETARSSLLSAAAPVWVLVGVAVLALIAGFVVGSFLKSPDDIASQSAPPPVGLITAAIEARQLTSTVIERADVEFGDPVTVNAAAPAGADTAVVTGRVPKVDATVSAGTVLLEVSGRPIIVLPGRFPAYRTIGPGSVGPDVKQLRNALKKLGYSAGNGGQTYDAALASAVGKLYKKAGYPAPGSQDLALSDAVRNAEDALTDARDAESQTNKQMSDAAQLPADEQEAALSDAKQALKDAKRGTERAEETLAAAKKAAWTPLPISEVVFVSGLPRRVNTVNVRLGQDLSDDSAIVAADDAGEASSVSGEIVLSDTKITATALVTSTEAALLQTGGPAELTTSEGTVVKGTIKSICDTSAAAQDDGTEAVPDCAVGITISAKAMRPDTPTGNMLVTFEVGKSAPDSLVVPVAAVSADSSGATRVEVVEGPLAKDAAAANQPTTMVTITTGLSADGYVEITQSEPTLKAGDLVVVGRAANAQASPSPAVPR